MAAPPPPRAATAAATRPPRAAPVTGRCPQPRSGLGVFRGLVVGGGLFAALIGLGLLCRRRRAAQAPRVCSRRCPLPAVGLGRAEDRDRVPADVDVGVDRNGDLLSLRRPPPEPSEGTSLLFTTSSAASSNASTMVSQVPLASPRAVMVLPQTLRATFTGITIWLPLARPPPWLLWSVTVRRTPTSGRRRTTGRRPGVAEYGNVLPQTSRATSTGMMICCR